MIFIKMGKSGFASIGNFPFPFFIPQYRQYEENGVLNTCGEQSLRCVNRYRYDVSDNPKHPVFNLFECHQHGSYQKKRSIEGIDIRQISLLVGIGIQ